MRSLKYLAALLPLHSLPVLAEWQESDVIVRVTQTRTVTFCPITEWSTCEADFPTDLPTHSPTKDTDPATTTTGDHHGGGNGGWGSSSYTRSTTSPVDPESTSSRHGGGWGDSSSHTGTTTGPVDPESTTSKHGGGWGDSSSHTGTTTGPVDPESTTSKHGGGWGDSSSSTSDYDHSTTSGQWTVSTSSATGTTSHHDGHDTTSSTSGANHGTSSSSVSNTHSTSTSGASTTSAVGSSTTSASTTTSVTTTSTSSCAAGTATVSSLAEHGKNTPLTRKLWGIDRSVDDDTDETFFTGKTKTYDFDITDASISFDGTFKPAYAINGKTPGEAIEANWGDLVEITVHNNLKDNATAIHWHGIRQIGSNDQDGVPGVTECAIPPGSSRTYKWHASTYGTGWYHSHAMAQYGGGIRGPIIIHGPATADYDYDLGTVMIDETYSQTIFQLAYNIARARGPLPPSTNYLLNGKNKSPDGTKGESAQWVVKKGKKHLFRIINSSAQSAFAVRFDNHKIKVISADFTPIVPYETEVLWIQSGQRYNVILEANQPAGAYYLRAVTQTGCGATSANNGLGTSNGIFSYEGSCPTSVTANNVTITTNTDCKDEPLASLVPHVKKTAGSASEFQSSVKLLPGGNAGTQNFDGYGPIIRWFFGGKSTDVATNSATPAGTNGINVTYDQPTLKTLSTLPTLEFNSSLYSNAVVLEGEKWVYFVIQNNFQTSHPMHLHGHDFSVLGQGRGVFTSDMVNSLNFVNPIRRDTALLFGIGSPTAFTSGWTVIGFLTDNPGAWVMHCHIIWHADGGMGLQYIERPKEIENYYGAQEFKDECSAYEQYEDNGGAVKATYEAGIKRHLGGHKAHGHSHVRRH